MFDFTFEAMGTVLSVRVLNQVSPILQEKIRQEILDFTVFYDESFSRFKKESLVTKISEKEGKHIVPKILVEMLRMYEDFNLVTEGAMNPLIGNTISDLGYDSDYTLRKKESVRSTPKLFETLQILSDTEIQTKEPVLIDIGALGKGFWVDQVGNILEKNKISHYIVNGSGDILYKTDQTESLSVALEDPVNGRDYIGNTKILNEALCGSGVNKRNWSVKDTDNLHHVIDANINLPTENVLAVWVKAKTCTLADGLATALFFTSPDKLLEKYSFEYYIIYSDKEVLASKNF